MPRPPGQITDTEPLELWEYALIMARLEPHWQNFYQLLWETGIRVSEALRVKRHDLENTGVWVTRTKRKDHPREHLPLSYEFYSRLRSWLELSHRLVIFPYTASAAWLALKKACVKAGVRQSIHPHSFRHGLGTRARQAGYDIAVVQRLLGHKDMKSTERYFKATKSEVETAFRKLNT